MSFSRGLESFPFRRSLVALVVSAVVLGGCSDGGEEPVEVSKTVEVPADADGDAAGSEAAAGEDAPIPFDEFDPSEYEVGDVVPEVEIVKPVEYPEMANNDEAGAEAAAQYMIDVLNYSYATGDISDFEKLSDPTCGMCASTLKIINDFYEEETPPVGPVYKTEDIAIYSKGYDGWILDLTVHYYETPVVNEKREVLGFFEKSGSFARQMVISDKEGGWFLRAFGEVAFE
ncbi:DUF6318 family protein [Jonesia quinghaiensis]|uniref:DUF6318 family protein n=1 Tax=Jonesia quinghaiensis TaxID=262806 RepID=UPI00042458BC|nr:DUF6318 family protein [Jonesia quinghaiensis]